MIGVQTYVYDDDDDDDCDADGDDVVVMCHIRQASERMSGEIKAIAA